MTWEYFIASYPATPEGADGLNMRSREGWRVKESHDFRDSSGYPYIRCLLEREIPTPIAPAVALEKIGSAMTLIDRLARGIAGLHSVVREECSACAIRSDGSYCTQCSSVIERAEDSYSEARKLFPGLPQLDVIERPE